MKTKIHPAAEIFPMMSDEEYAGLKDDIKANKQQEPICYWRGELIDGRNRLKACQELGIKIDSWELDKDADPVAYVLSRNLHRRHLSTSQRSMVAGKLANLCNGSNQHKTVGKYTKEGTQNCVPSKEAAGKLNVSTRSVVAAKQVIEGGSAEVKRAVEADEISVSLAAKLVEEVPSKAEQTKLIKQGSEAVKEAVTVPKKVKPGEIKPELTTKERAAFLKKSIKQYNAYMMRAVDDLQAILPNKAMHEAAYQAFRTIDESIGGWK